jgi:hypothetical protein
MVYLLHLSQFLALSWNFELPGNFHSQILDATMIQETESEPEIVFPPLPPAFTDTKESGRGAMVESKRPAPRRRIKRRAVSQSVQRKNKKKASKMPQSCMYLAYRSHYVRYVLQLSSLLCILCFIGHVIKKSIVPQTKKQNKILIYKI